MAINMEAFKADINNSDLIKNPKSNATELAQQYDIHSKDIVDTLSGSGVDIQLP